MRFVLDEPSTVSRTARTRAGASTRVRVLCAALLALGGCAHVAPPPTEAVPTSGEHTPDSVVRVLVLPVVLEAGAARDTLPLTDALERGAVGGDARVEAVRALGPEALDETCRDRASCLRALGAEAGVDYVLAAQVAVLGSAAIVRARLVDVDAEDGEVQRQQTLEGATDASLAESLAALGDALASPLRPLISPPAPDRRPRRVRIAVPVAAVGAAALAVGLGVGLRPDQPDLVIVPP